MKKTYFSLKSYRFSNLLAFKDLFLLFIYFILFLNVKMRGAEKLELNLRQLVFLLKAEIYKKILCI